MRRIGDARGTPGAQHGRQKMLGLEMVTRVARAAHRKTIAPSDYGGTGLRISTRKSRVINLVCVSAQLAQFVSPDSFNGYPPERSSWVWPSHQHSFSRNL
eukprot:366551-Chlamydomonas_euryale.AAC.46